MSATYPEAREGITSSSTQWIPLPCVYSRSAERCIEAARPHIAHLAPADQTAIVRAADPLLRAVSRLEWTEWRISCDGAASYAERDAAWDASQRAWGDAFRALTGGWQCGYCKALRTPGEDCRTPGCPDSAEELECEAAEGHAND